MTNNTFTDKEMLNFLLDQFQGHSVQMNGKSHWRFSHSWPCNRLVGSSVREAVIAAMMEEMAHVLT
jgi:hypothetical protein